MEYFVLLDDKLDSQWSAKEDLIQYIEDLVNEGDVNFKSLFIIQGEEIWFYFKIKDIRMIEGK